MAGLELGKMQERTVGVALTIVSGAVIVLTLLGLFSGLVLFAQRFSGVFLPLALAGLLALVLKPYYQWWSAKTGGRDVLTLIVVYLTVLLPLVAFIWFFGGIVIEQLVGFFRHIPVWLQHIREFLVEKWPAIVSYWEEHEVGMKLQELLEQHGAVLTEGVKVMGMKAVSAGAGIFVRALSLFSWVVFPIYLTFFLMQKPVDLEDVKDEVLPFLKPQTRQDIFYLIQEFVMIMVAFFRGQLLVALCQGILFAVGFMLAGLQYGFVLGLALGFLNVIPYLGSMLGLGMALPLAFFQEGGGLATLGWVVVVFSLVQMIEGYYLTPTIMGSRTGLHPMVIMVALFFWGSVFGGVAGMVLAIPLTAFLVVFWRLLKTKYIRELV